MLGAMYDADTERAIRAALDAHRGQARKSAADTPYVSHPFHVALILARIGAPPRVLQAALLHDAVEDCERWTLARVEREFGAHVAGVVAELTEDKSLTWAERKLAQIDHVPRLSRDALLVKAVDKLHNLRTLAEGLRSAAAPAAFWAQFRGGPERTLEHARLLVAALAARCDPRLASALRTALREVESAANAHDRR
jgi:(p)ppGpp synthase/HD superfamily hydrolase